MNGQEMKINSVKEAKKIILDSIKPITKTEIINLDKCINRILKNTLSSKRTQPSFDTSSMDGYAISKKNIKKLPLRLKVKDEIKAGDIPKFSLIPTSVSYLAPLQAGLWWCLESLVCCL